MFAPQETPELQDSLLSPADFAARVRQKHPKVYDGLSDDDLTNKVLEKYPEYQSSVRHPRTQTFDVGQGFSVSVTPPEGLNVTLEKGGQKVEPVGSPAPRPEETLWGRLENTPMDEKQFAAKIRSKYPKVYDSVDDGELSRRVLKNYPEYQPHVRLSDAALRPSVKSTVVEDVNFDEPIQAPAVENFKPINFQPFTEKDLSFSAKLAAGASRFAGEDLGDVPAPLRMSQRIKASVKTGGRLPTQAELTDAMLAGLGAQSVGQRYAAEVGRPVVTPDISEETLRQGYDAKAGTYNFEFSLPHYEVRLLNAYAVGGLDAAHEEDERIRKEMHEDHEQRVKDATLATAQAASNPLSGAAGAVKKGIARGMGMGTANLINNAQAVLGKDPQAAARDAGFIQNAGAAIPPEKSGLGQTIEGVSSVLSSAPRYIAAGPGAGVVAYTENLHRGQEAAIKAGLRTNVAAGIARGTGQATEGMSPFARQLTARNVAGATNVAMGKLAGDKRSALGMYLEGALLPTGIGKGPKRYTHEVLGEMVEVPNQSGIGRGFVRVQDSNGEVFVVRAPNPSGQGGVRRANGSLPTRNPGERVVDVANVMRATQTAYDLSGLGRQSISLALGNPGKAARAFVRSIPALVSETRAARLQHEIDSSPLAPVRRDAGLFLSDYHYSGKSLLGSHEEGFQSSVAQLIPGVRGSERAYNAMLNKLRADVFDNYVRVHSDAPPETLQGVARFINAATGRGSLGRLEGTKFEPVLNQIFYSPRFQLSRAQMPLELFRGTPASRKFAAGELLKYVGAGVGLMQMAKMAGADVSFNPLSSDFGKIKIGRTRLSIWGGNETLARYTAQAVAGKATELESGRTVDRSRARTGLQFLRTKLSPQISVPLDTVLGSSAAGEKASLADDWHSGVARRAFMPLAWRDVEDAVHDDLQHGGSGWGGALKGAPSLLGFGANTITPKTPGEKAAEKFPAELAVQRGKEENRGLLDPQLEHNTRVAVALKPYYRQIAESGLDESKQEILRHDLNERFMWARVRGLRDRRELKAIEQVFSDRQKGVDEYMRKRIEELKK